MSLQLFFFCELNVTSTSRTNDPLTLNGTTLLAVAGQGRRHTTFGSTGRANGGDRVILKAVKCSARYLYSLRLILIFTNTDIFINVSKYIHISEEYYESEGVLVFVRHSV
jgi:hypothetical protein